MSLTSRARNLARLTGWPHQRCVNELRNIGVQADAFAQDADWPVQRAELYLINNDFDEEYAEVSHGARYVRNHRCAECGKLAFHGLDKKGTHVSGYEEHCPECVGEYGVWTCSRCGSEIAGSPTDTDVCSNCWDHIVNRDD